MALTFGFYNSIDHDRQYDAIQFGQIFDGIITDGIYATYLKSMVVIASSNANEVIIQPGRAWFNHTWSYNDANLPFSAPDPEVLLDRIDTLVLDINSEQAERANRFMWVQGTPSSRNPQAPSLIRSVTHNQYPLCNVYRKAGTTMIYQEDITNRIGTSDCPFVTGVLTGLDVDEMLRQWAEQYERFIITKQTDFETWEETVRTGFENWETAQKNDFETWKTSEQTTFFSWIEDIESHYQTSFTNWFAHLQDELDSNQAAHLQAQIDAISYMYVIDNVLYLPNTGASISGSKLILTNHN